MSEAHRSHDVRGPVESVTWPSQLKSRVVEPGARPRLHGFDVQSDLARHFSFAEVVLTTLLGKEPDPTTGAVFEKTLTFLTTRSVLEAPVHAACVAQLCGAPSSAVIGIGAMTLAEQARFAFEFHRELLEWLETDGSEPPKKYQAPEHEREACRRFRAALGEIGFRPTALAHDLNLQSAIMAVLHACGLSRQWQFEVALTLAGLPAAAAESAAVQSGDFRSYPMNLPPFVYDPSYKPDHTDD